MPQRFAVLVALTIGLTPALVACGVWGPKGNDTGGIIPWSPDNQRIAMTIAQDNCGRYSKYARITSVHPVYGDYIAYECRFDPPRYRRR